MELVVVGKEETLVVGERNRAAGGDGELVLVLDRLARGDLRDFPVYQGILGLLISLEAPRVESRIAEHVDNLSVVLGATRLDREADGAGALVLGGRAAGDDLKLVDGLDRNSVGNDAVVALLVGGRRRDAIDVDLGEIVACTREDGSAGSTLGADRKRGQCGGITLLIVHHER